MAQEVTSPKAEDLLSVGSRISWGAITAGAVVALALQFLLAVLGGAVGVSISDNVRPENLRMGAIIWTIVTACASLFVGGLVTSQLTVGENKTESLLYGIIMWAMALALLLGLGAAGTRVSWSATVGMANLAHAPTPSGEIAATKVTMPADPKQPENTTEPRHETSEATKRVTWYAFGAIWGTMIAAALGALVGAGPTFRLVTTREVVRP